MLLLSSIVTLALLWRGTTAQNCDADVMFILDASGSVEQNYKNMIQFSRGISDLLTVAPNGHRVSFIAYSGRNTKILSVPFGIIQTNEQFNSAVDNLPYFKGTTYTARALDRAYELLKDRRKNRLTVVLVVTDGFSHDDVVPISKRIRDLPDVEVYVAAIPDLISKRGMAAISGNPDRIFFQPDVLNKATIRLKEILRCVPFHDPTTRPPTQRPTTRPTTPSPTTTTTTPTTTTQRITGCEVDLLLIFDFSGSVSGIHESYVDMAVDLVDSLRVDPFFTRVALVKYSSRAWAHAVFHFDSYDNARDVKSALRGTPYMGGTTDTNRALETGALEYDVKFGARPGLAKFVTVIFTDGYSQHDPSPAARAIRDMGVELYAVCREEDDYPPNYDELQIITGTDSRVFESQRIGDLARQLSSYNSRCR